MDALPRLEGAICGGAPPGLGMPAAEHMWAGAAAAFLLSWMGMMVPMMLPSLAPALWRYQRSLGTGDAQRRLLVTTVAGIAYYAVWAAIGLAVFAAGAALARVAAYVPALAGAVPVAAGVVVVIAGVVQFTAWKSRMLACCRAAYGPGARPPSLRAAWRRGVRLGLHCSRCCAGLTAILLAVGMMDVRAMIAVTAAITLERLAPAGVRVAHATGAVAVAAGIVLIARAAGLA